MDDRVLGTAELGEPDLPLEYVQHVKDALEHLYDLAYLQRHALVHIYGHAAGASGEMAGQRLRRELADAIEALNPGPQTPFQSPRARPYNLLRLRYIEGLTVREAAHELGLSIRQAHRDLRQAEESVAAVLWARRGQLAELEPRAAHLSSIDMEMSRIEMHPRPTVIVEVLRRAMAMVTRQADLHGVRLDLEDESDASTLSVDPLIAEQVLVNMLSEVVAHAEPGQVRLRLALERGLPCLTMRFLMSSVRTPVLDFVVSQLVERLGWTVTQERSPEGETTVIVQMGGQGPSILVIDDNEGLVSLLDRYLTDQRCRVIPATEAREGLDLAQELIPDVIVLDIMMPEMHGWEVLQRLRNHPRTRDIPVVVCSIIDNPDLAYSLGASFFLRKPISRQALLDALHQLDIL
ncbi:MAG: hypothetical protein Kow0047_24780 [Anaerolineae bacterium]